MGEVVAVLGAWGVSLIVVGLLVGVITRAVTAFILSRQAEHYRRVTGNAALPVAMPRSTATVVAIGVVLGTIALGLVAEVVGIRPPGATPFTFATFFVAVMPASAIGAAWGASMGVTKGALSRGSAEALLDEETAPAR